MQRLWLSLVLICLSATVQAGLRPGLFSDGLLRASQVEGEQFPRTLIDPLGGRHLLASPPQRIVSVALASDEMLSALDAHSQVVAVTHLVDQPGLSNVTGRYAGSVQRISGEVEEILALRPDLVVVASYTRLETVRLLLGAGVPVLRLAQTTRLSDLGRNLNLLASATGHRDKAREILDNLPRPSPVSAEDRRRVLYYDLSGSSVGQGDLTDELITLAGGFNVMREVGLQGMQPVSTELAISLLPDVILLSGWQSGESAIEHLLQDPAWQQVPAIKNHRVYLLQGAWRSAASHYRWQGLPQLEAVIRGEVTADE